MVRRLCGATGCVRVGSHGATVEGGPNAPSAPPNGWPTAPLTRRSHGPKLASVVYDSGCDECYNRQCARVPDPRAARGRRRRRPARTGRAEAARAARAAAAPRGEVVSTDRLIDQLWGEEPPRTAATSLQNFVSQLRKVLAPDVLVTQAAGVPARGRRRAASTSRASSGSSRRRARQEPEPRARDRCARRWRSGAARRSRTSRSSRSRRARSGGSRSSGWRRSRSGSTPTSSSGRHRELVGELEALVAGIRSGSGCAAS